MTNITQRILENFNKQYTNNGVGKEWRFEMEITPSMIQSFILTSLHIHAKHTLEEILGEVENLMTNNSDYNKGIQDCINLLKKEI